MKFYRHERREEIMRTVVEHQEFGVAQRWIPGQTGEEMDTMCADRRENAVDVVQRDRPAEDIEKKLHI